MLLSTALDLSYGNDGNDQSRIVIFKYHTVLSKITIFLHSKVIFYINNNILFSILILFHHVEQLQALTFRATICTCIYNTALYYLTPSQLILIKYNFLVDCS